MPFCRWVHARAADQGGRITKVMARKSDLVECSLFLVTMRTRIHTTAALCTKDRAHICPDCKHASEKVASNLLTDDAQVAVMAPKCRNYLVSKHAQLGHVTWRAHASGIQMRIWGRDRGNEFISAEIAQLRSHSLSNKACSLTRAAPARSGTACSMPKNGHEQL